MRGKTLLLVVSAFFLGLFVASFGGYYVLAHGGDTNLIHACVKDSSGSIRIVGPNDNCNSNESPLDWHKDNSAPFACIGCYIGFEEANRLKNKDLTNSILNTSSIVEADFSGTDFTNALIRGGTLTQNNFVAANFANVKMSTSNINSNDFTNVNFTGTDLSGGGDSAHSNNFTNANFTNANLSGTNFNPTGTENDFTGAIWNNTTCPDGTNSNNNGNTCIGHLTP